MTPQKRKAFPNLWYSKKLKVTMNCILILLLGALSGFLLCHYSIGSCARLKRCGDLHSPVKVLHLSSVLSLDSGRDHPNVDNHQFQTQNDNTGSIFVGVMTAKKFLDTRAMGVFRTWASTIPGKVEFFSSIQDKEGYSGLPIVDLPGVTDNMYPPQKKSFMMLKYMHDKYIDKYEWFVRSDDDVFIRGEKLAKFLHSINSSKPYYIGQAGQGLKSEVGKLSLKSNENFCMGGTSMIFSRETLKRIVPHISYCLNHLYTKHEDVEVGRCVGKFANVQCTWAFEMQHMFYQNHEEPKGSYSREGKLDEIPSAITLHPVKDSRYLYRIHNHYQTKKIQDLKHRLMQLQRSTFFMDQLLGDEQHGKSPKKYLKFGLSLTRYSSLSRQDLVPWDFFHKYQYNLGSQNPRQGLTMFQVKGLNHIIRKVMRLVNKNARQRGRTIDYKDILYGYQRVNPLYGADYILDLLLIYRKHKGKRITVNVRRHAYVQQSFSEPEILVEDLLESSSSQSNDLHKSAAVEDPRTVHFILPLAGRFEPFTRFLNNFENTCLKTGDKVELAVVLFSEVSESRPADVIQLVQKLKAKYPTYDLRVVELKGAFSRALALTRGSDLYDSNALLFFIDVDIYFSQEAVERVRVNTKFMQQVYYPIVFSRYSEDAICPQGSCSFNPFIFTDTHGYWRFYGFGMTGIYKGDLVSAGGFDLRIEGWGKEDVDLCEKVSKTHLRLFRAADPGLVHFFHQSHCDKSLPSIQYQMCQGSGARSFASQEYLANLVYNNHHLLNKEVINNNAVGPQSTTISTR
ncbi:chondroitin sulfate synthase 1-like [Lineus longissimus]|uniref:chondroitin sulfate synthase 1-like n=1 Tax=Lineus longissimus TaxID=88925 RepID=UPI002B4C412A